MNVITRKSRRNKKSGLSNRTAVSRVLFYFLLVTFYLFTSCSSPPTEMRALVSSETLVYLETNDLGRLLRSLQENRVFDQAMISKTDFSAVNGMQLAVAVTGFEASENQVTTENSVLNFKPKFVAVADTHTWNRYTLQFVEEKLGNFVNETYGGEVTLDRSDRPTGKYFVWTATDGRKVFAFVSGSRIFFSNDEAVLEKSLAAARGEADSMAKNETVLRLANQSKGSLAYGYVTTDGVAQLSSVAGVSTAVEATDDEDGRSFIARVFPELVRNSVKDIAWTATKSDNGIDDKYQVNLKPETAEIFKETMKPAGAVSDLTTLIPSDPFVASRYSLASPQIAWRSLLLVAGKNGAAENGRIIVAFAGSLLEPYGISDAETFLSAVGPEIWTVSFDADGDDSAAIVSIRDPVQIKKSIPEIDFSVPAELRDGFEFRKSSDGQTTLAIVEGKLVLGDTDAVIKCLRANADGKNFGANAAFARFKGNNATVVTFGREATDKTAALLGTKKEENLQFMTNYLVETRFTDRGLERRTSSPFGLVGRMIGQLAE